MLWRAPEDRWLVVHSVRDLMLYLRIGGMWLLTPEIVKYWMPGVLTPRECTPDPHAGEGFVAIGGEGAAPRAHDRAPTRKLRMEVVKRDGFRCCVCGRRASDHVDLELAVHHVIPVEHGGPTIEPNLMTLCTTCHKGLDPHYEVLLRELAGLPGNIDTLSVDRINNFQIRDNLIKGFTFEARGIGVRGSELVIDSRELIDGLRVFRQAERRAGAPRAPPARVNVPRSDLPSTATASGA